MTSSSSSSKPTQGYIIPSFRMDNNEDYVPVRFNYVSCRRDKLIADMGDLEFTAVKFCTSRYDKHSKTLTAPIGETWTAKCALEKAEEWLSQPMTEEHYESIKDDTFHSMDWAEAQQCMRLRGEGMGDRVFLEHFAMGKGPRGRPTLVIRCGS